MAVIAVIAVIARDRETHLGIGFIYTNWRSIAAAPPDSGDDARSRRFRRFEYRGHLSFPMGTTFSWQAGLISLIFRGVVFRGEQTFRFFHVFWGRSTAVPA